MGGIYLAVDQSNIFSHHLLDEGDEGIFTGIGLMAEHTLSEEDMAEPDSVQPPCQFVAIPGFHTVGISGFVEFDVSAFHVSGDPGSALSISFGDLAGSDHSWEILVNSYLKSLTLEQDIHAFAEPEFIRIKDETGIRGVPNRDVSTEPGEDPASVGEQESILRKVAAIGQGTVCISKCQVRETEYSFIQLDHGAITRLPLNLIKTLR